MAEPPSDQGRDDRKSQSEEEQVLEEKDFILVIEKKGLLEPNPEYVINKNKNILPVSDIHSAEGHMRAEIELIARMTWPRDEDKREELIVSYAGLNAEGPEPIYDEILRQYGGPRRLAKCRAWEEIESDAEKQFLSWSVPHLVIANIWRSSTSPPVVPDQASVNKAIFLVHEYWPYFSDVALEAVPKNMSEIRATWARFRPVAHLCSAYLALASKYPDPSISGIMRLELKSLLSIARAIQTWGTTFKPPRTKTYLFPPEELWWVPYDLELAPPIIAFPNLTADEIEILKRYRAPKRRSNPDGE